MTRRLIIILCLTLLTGLAARPAGAVRIKDVASLRGVRSNQLVGYGLIVGLNGTGDKSSTVFTVQGLTNMLNRMGMRMSPNQVSVKNVAAVMVTSSLPPFARAGSHLDVTVSSLGDSTSLAGGTLIITPLKGIDGKIYAVAQGPVSVGGFQAGGEAATVSKNHPTVGRIPRGALVEREVGYQFGQERNITLDLDTPDFTTAGRVAKRINEALPQLMAQAQDPSTIALQLPPVDQGRLVDMIAKMENLEISPDVSAKVVIDERTGTVVMGEAVRISTVAVASGALSISITESAEVSQALPLAPGGQTVAVPQTQVRVGEQKSKLALVKSGVSIGDVVKALNALGATPRDLIVILQAIKAAGALQAQLEII
jgi:flagellar P-ring protein precursor FlgI